MGKYSPDIVVSTVYESCLTVDEQVDWIYRKVLELDERVKKLEEKIEEGVDKD